jgi:hypothetical protein
MDWMIRVLEFNSWRGLGIFLFTTTSRTALGPTQPPIQWVPGALSLGVKQLGHEAIPPFPQYVFMAWYLVKHRDFTFTLLIMLHYVSHHFLIMFIYKKKGKCADLTDTLINLLFYLFIYLFYSFTYLFTF